MSRRARGDAGQGPPLVTSEAFAALAPEWAALHARIPSATPFTHPKWHETWLRHFGQHSAPVFLSIRYGEELVGVAALDLDRDVARTLGDHNVRDYGGPLALPGCEEGIARGLLDWLAEDLTPAAELWGVASDSPIAAAFAEVAEDAGWTFESTPEAVCPGIDLPGDFETYVASLSKKDRHELRRKLRNLEAAGTVAFDSATGGQVPVAVERMLEMMRASREDKDEFLTPAMAAFFLDLAQELGAAGIARAGTLTIDGEPAAMVLQLETGDRTYLYNSGYEPRFAPLAVGLASKAYAIRDCIARGRARFDFLRGDEEYKRRLGGVPRELVTLRLRSRTPL